MVVKNPTHNPMHNNNALNMFDIRMLLNIKSV